MNFFVRSLIVVAAAVSIQMMAAAQKPEAKNHFVTAKEQIELENYKDAEASLRKALAIEPDYEEALSALGDVLMQADDFSGAKACFEKLVKLHSKKAEYMISLSTAFYNLDKPYEAIEWAAKAIGMDANNDFAYYKRGLALLKKKDTAAAMKDFDTAIRIDPEYFDYHFSKGFILFYQDQYQAAKAEFEKCIQLNAANTDALYYLGGIEFAMQNYAVAAGLFDKIIVLDSANVDAYYYRAKCDMNLENNAGAIRFFSKGIELDSSYAGYDMLFSRGIAFYNIDKYYNSIRDLGAFLKYAEKENADRATASYFLAFNYHDLGQFETGLKHANEALAIDNNDADAWFAKGICLLSLKDNTEACRAFRTAAEKGKTGIEELMASCK